MGRVGESDTATSNVYNEWNILSESFYLGYQFTNTTSTTIHTDISRYNYFQPAGYNPGVGAGLAGGTSPAGAAFGTVAAGVFDPSRGMQNESQYARFWTSSVAASTYPNSMLVPYATIMYPGNLGSYAHTGASVRCVM